MSTKDRDGWKDATDCSPSSLTPETDVKVKRICGNWNNAGDRVQEFVLADFARKLERERDEARRMWTIHQELLAAIKETASAPKAPPGPWEISLANAEVSRASKDSDPTTTM